MACDKQSHFSRVKYFILEVLTKHFTKKLSVDGKVCDFNFRRIYTVDNYVYFVSEGSGSASRFHFRMTVSHQGWKIQNASMLPEWIIKLESQLSDAIVENQ